MNNLGGGESFKIELDDSQINSIAKRVAVSINNIGDTAEKQGVRIDSAFKKIGLAVGSYFAYAQVQSFADAVIKVRSEIESLEISFRTLLGNKQKADALLADLKQFAVSTPMQMKDLAQGAQTMLGFGIEADKVMTLLKQIGDVSMGDAQKFQSLTLAFSQATAAGKLQGQDLLQLINAGFNPLNEIAKKTGKTIAELKDDMSAGKIGADMLADAFKSATSEGGQFYKMLENQGNSINGAMNKLQGAWDDMLNDIGKNTQDTFTDAINYAADAVAHYREFLNVIMGLTSAYGAYKTVLMATVAIEQAKVFADNIRLVMMFRKELGLLTAAQQAFNITASANPYAILAAAIVGVSAAVFMYGQKLNNTNAELDKYHQKAKEVADADRERKEYIDGLVEVAKNESASTDKRREALEKLEKYYPNIFAQYDTEAEKLAHILEIQNALNAAQGREALHNQLKTVVDSINEIRARGNSYTRGRMGIYEGKMYSLKDIEALKRLEQQRKELIKQITTNNYEEQQANKASTDNAAVERNHKYWEDKKKAAEDALKLLDVSKKGTAEWKKYEAEIREAERELEKYSTSRGGGGSKASQNIAKELDEYERTMELSAVERIRIAKDLELKVAQARIDAMADGAEKEREQMLLDFEREKEELKRQQEDYLQQKKDTARSVFEDNPTNKGKVFDDSTVALTSEETQAFDELDKYIEEKYAVLQASLLRQERLAMDEYLSQYGTFAEQIQAVTNLYEQEIANARTRGEKLYLDKKKDEQIANIKLQEIALSIDWGATFEGVGQVLQDAAKVTLEKVEAFINSPQFKALDENAKRNVYALKSRLKTESGLTDSATFGTKQWKELAEVTKRYQSSVKELIASNDRIRSAQKKLEEAHKQLEESTDEASRKVAQFGVEAAEQALELAKSEQELYKDQVAEAQQNLTDATDAASRGISQFNEALGGLTSGSLYGLYNGIMKLSDLLKTTSKDKDVLSNIGNVVGTAGGVWGAVIGAILQILDAIGDDVNGFVDDLFDKISKAVNSIIEETFNGDTFAASFANLADLLANAIGGLWNGLEQTFTNPLGIFDSFGKAFGKKFNDPKHEAKIQELQEAIDKLEESYKTLQKTIDETYGKTKSNAIQQKRDAQELQKQLVEQQLAEEQSKKNPDDDVVKKYKDKISDIEDELETLEKQTQDAIFGEDIQSAIERFADAYMSAWDAGTDKAMASKNAVREMVRKMVTENVKDFIQQSEVMRELQAKIKKYLSDGILTAVEQQDLEKTATELQEKVDRLYDSSVGQYLRQDSSQDSTAGGFATMTQESANELNGRFTALQMYGADIRTHIAEMSVTVVAANETLTNLRGQVQESIALQNVALEHLSAIEKNTRQLYQMNERLNNIERNTSRL